MAVRLTLYRIIVAGFTDRPDITSAVNKGRQVSPVQKSVVGITDRPDITPFVYKGCQLTLPRKSVVGITDRPDITSAVYKGRQVNPAQVNRGWYNGPSRHNLSCLQRP